MGSINLEETAEIMNITTLILVLNLSMAMAALHTVGDSAGWTALPGLDYKQWAAPKTFQLRDVIVFVYNPQFHNVMQVTHAQYRACNASFPISTHTSGNDSVRIESPGHHFFLCGVPGHCQAGQKVDINVLSVAQPPTKPLGGSTDAPVPAPSRSDAPAPLLPLNHITWICLAILPILLSTKCQFN